MVSKNSMFYKQKKVSSSPPLKTSIYISFSLDTNNNMIVEFSHIVAYYK